MQFLSSQDSLGKNTGVDCHALLQGIQSPRDQTHVSCITGGFLTAEPRGVGSPFPGSTVVNSLSFQRRERSSIPGLGNKIPHARQQG